MGSQAEDSFSKGLTPQQRDKPGVGRGRREAAWVKELLVKPRLHGERGPEDVVGREAGRGG